jgi:glycosyltransferase involved in cell wall biosynthesis
MKILQVVSYFYPAWSYGGPPRVVYELSKELARRNHEVTVYTTDSLDPKNRIETASHMEPVELEGMRVYYFRNLSNWLAGTHHMFLPPSLIRAARHHLKEFDVIHLNEARTMVHLPVQHYAERYGIPYILQAHGSLPRMMAKQGFKQVYDRLWGFRTLRGASKVIALTKAEAEEYKDMGVSEDRIEVIPNGINLSEFENLPERGKFRRKYSLNDSQKMILYLGRMHKIKGLDLLAEAFAGFSSTFNDVNLVISGSDDGYFTTLKELVKSLKIEEKVLFTGPLYGRDKLEAYIDADVCVLPSLHEGFPVSVLEAGVCGKPVIVTDRCNVADMVNNEMGLTVSYDKNQLQGALAYLLNDKGKRQDFGQHGAELVHREFSWSHIAERVERLYQTVVDKAKSAQFRGKKAAQDGIGGYT